MAVRTTPTPGVTSDGWVSLGVIARPHGVKGALKLHLWNDARGTTALLHAGLDIQVGGVPHKVGAYASGILYLDGLSDRTAAEGLQGREVLARRADFPADDPDDVYLIDLIGAPVSHVDGRLLGRVTAISDNGAQPLQVLAVAAGVDEVLVPYVDAIVQSASPAGIVLTPPLGLFNDDDALVHEETEP